VLALGGVHFPDLMIKGQPSYPSRPSRFSVSIRYYNFRIWSNLNAWYCVCRKTAHQTAHQKALHKWVSSAGLLQSREFETPPSDLRMGFLSKTRWVPFQWPPAGPI